MQRIKIRAKSISIAYGQNTIIHDLSCQIQTGKLTVLVGPNGSGKSTILKSFARIIPILSGQVLLDDEDVHKTATRAIAKKIAFLPQGSITPEGISVHELVAQGRYPHQSLFNQWSYEDEQAVENALEMTSLKELAQKPVSSLSGGQRQRVWIAMILAQETDTLLLDEPTTFLDLKVQIELLSLLKNIAYEHGKTILAVLHDLNVAAAFADQMIMLRKGKIYTYGGIKDVFTSENLKHVFDLDAKIYMDETNNIPVCIPHVYASNQKIGEAR